MKHRATAAICAGVMTVIAVAGTSPATAVAISGSATGTAWATSAADSEGGSHLPAWTQPEDGDHSGVHLDHADGKEQMEPGDSGTPGAHDHGSVPDPSPERPRGLVLGSFAAVNGGVLVAAALLRRRTRGEIERRRSARAAALHQQ